MGASRELRARVRTVSRRPATGLVERDEAARLVLLAALAGEHALLLGPPGTAKSELARRLHGVVRGGGYFERLLTRFSVPEELFGPLSIKALEADRYHRLTASYLPTASVAFLDEVFKANSAILNALLSVLNERLFDNGAERERVPLVCLVAASNEVPEGDELRALHDRFLVRAHLPPVSDGAFEAMLSAVEAPFEDVAFSPEELTAARVDALRVIVPSAVTAHLRAMRAWLDAQKVYVSDRRWRRIVGLLRVAAWTDGRDAVTLWDCALAVACVWERPAQLDAVRAWHRERVDQAARAEPERYARLVETLERQLSDERSARAAKLGLSGAPLYADASGKVFSMARVLVPATTPLGEALYVPPSHVPGPHPPGGYTAKELLTHCFAGRLADAEIYAHDETNRARVVVELAPLTEPARYTHEHVESRLRQVGEVTRDLTAFVRALQQSAEVAAGDEAPLWSPPELTAEEHARAGEGLAKAVEVGERLKRLREGFAALPRVSP